jgi:hypothetical protein
MWRLIKFLLKTILAVVVAVVLIPAAGLGYGFLTTDAIEIRPYRPPTAEAGPSPAVAATLAAEIPGYKRPEESTFLTYPEWAIVYAAREYAELVSREFPSAFPYWAYTGRFWQDYALMIRASSAYPFNFENHLMLTVIGTSQTVENAVQSIYENTVGRITEAVAGYGMVPEDDYQAAAAAEYAAFLDQVPWYLFPYAEKRSGLFGVATAGGLASVRSWERKLGFGLAYSVKQGYAALIQQGLAATSDPALLDIHVWATGPVADAIAGEADTALERDFGADGAAFVTKRYQVFTEMIPRLAAKGVRFVEIGGNRLIFLTVLYEDDLAAPDSAQVLFDYALPARPETRRAGIVAEVGSLHELLPTLAAAGAALEHVYDY